VLIGWQIDFLVGTASLGPFGPGFLGHGLDENRRRYLRRTNA
jgi:hypothetical protein